MWNSTLLSQFLYGCQCLCDTPSPPPRQDSEYLHHKFSLLPSATQTVIKFQLSFFYEAEVNRVDLLNLGIFHASWNVTGAWHCCIHTTVQYFESVEWLEWFRWMYNSQTIPATIHNECNYVYSKCISHLESLILFSLSTIQTHFFQGYKMCYLQKQCVCRVHSSLLAPTVNFKHQCIVTNVTGWREEESNKRC